MRYYVVSDIHGYYTEFIKALTDKGYFDYQGDKKIIVCGDLMDRGKEACKVQSFVLDAIERDDIILIRGNHEDLYEKFILKDRCEPTWTHAANGTYSTALQLTGIDDRIAYDQPGILLQAALETPFYHLIPSMLDYYETEHYIFVHGWIPAIRPDGYHSNDPLQYNPDWRNAPPHEWAAARWVNGMDAVTTVKEPGKTIVCGHWHCSYGHYMYEYKGTEECGADSDFSPYYADGIIAIDACTAQSKIVNCIVIDD